MSEKNGPKSDPEIRAAFLAASQIVAACIAKGGNALDLSKTAQIREKVYELADGFLNDFSQLSRIRKP